MSHSVRDLLSAIAAQDRWLSEQSGELGRLTAAHRSELAAYEKQESEAWTALAQTALPSLDDEALTRAAALLLLSTVEPAAARTQEEQLKTFFEKKIADIKAEVPSEEAARQRINEVEIRFAEIEQAIEPIEEPVARVEEEEYFGELIHKRYGTDDYDVAWWRASYYRHWKHGDLIVEKHAAQWQIEDFGELRKKYVEQRHARDTLAAERDQLVGDKRRVERLVEELRNWRQQLVDVKAVTLRQLQDRVREHLDVLDLAEVHKLLEGAPALALAAKRVDGVRAKRRYLEAYFERFIAPLRAQIDKMSSKNRRHSVKYRRPKHRGTLFSDGEFASRFRSPREKFEQRFGRYSYARSRLWEFDDYNAWDHRARAPWFVHIDDGRMKGRFIDEVRVYKESASSRDHRQAQAVRAVAPQTDDLADWS